MASGEPVAIEFVIGVGAAGFVPIAFVDGDHFAGVAGDAAVGEEVRRVGEDEVDGIWRDGGEDIEAVALVEAEVVFGVVEGGGGEWGARRGVAAIRVIAVSCVENWFRQVSDPTDLDR